jgi:hypothetical protein
MSLWSRIRSRFSRSKSTDTQILLNDGGIDIVSVPGGKVLASLQWADVTRIQAYKVDLVTTDCICLLFERGVSAPPLQVSEDWLGFQELFNPLVQHFPAIPESWYEDIMTPAFEEKRTVLFDSSGDVRAAIV